MRWLIYAWALSVLLALSPITAIADSESEAAPIVTTDQSESTILNRYLATGQDRQTNNVTPMGAGEFERGAECPSGSGRYCSNALPYCCRSASGSVYCAPNAGACTR